jgi:hypothetical protein
MSYAEYIAAKQTTDAQYLALRTAGKHSTNSSALKRSGKSSATRVRLTSCWHHRWMACRTALQALSLAYKWHSKPAGIIRKYWFDNTQQRCKRHCGYGVQYVKSLIVGKAMSSPQLPHRLQRPVSCHCMGSCSYGGIYCDTGVKRRYRFGCL